MTETNNTKSKVSLTPGQIAKLRIGMFLGIIAGVIVFGAGCYEYWEHLNLQRQGVTIQGKVLSNEVLSTGKGRVSCRLVVEYKPEGAPVHEKLFLGVPEKIFENAVSSGSIDVKYLPKKPSVSQVSPDGQSALGKVAGGVGAFFACLFILIFLNRQKKKMTVSES